MTQYMGWDFYVPKNDWQQAEVSAWRLVFTVASSEDPFFSNNKLDTLPLEIGTSHA